jgi:hypothetical protein
MLQVNMYNARLKTVAAANKATVLDVHAACVDAIATFHAADGKTTPAPTFRPALFAYDLTAVFLLRMITGSLDKVRVSEHSVLANIGVVRPHASLLRLCILVSLDSLRRL